MTAHPTEHILIATDLEGVAERAITWGVELAKRFDASITLLHASRFEPPMSVLQSSISGAYSAIEERRAEARARVENLAARLVPPSVRHEILVVRDLPANAIVENAARAGCDLIVMGPRTRSGWHAILGSETELVLYQTSIPLLAVRAQQPDEPMPPPRIARVLCPVNYTPVALDALRRAASLAAAFAAELLVVHVEEEESDGIERLTSWIPRDLPVVPRFCEKPPARNVAEQVIASISSEGADIVVVGAQHRRFADSTVIGMTTTRLLRHSPVPVLTTFRRNDR